MAEFLVKVIRKGREADYRAFWLEGRRKNDEGEELHSDLVGKTELVKAKNRKEAIAKARELNPGLNIDEAATQRVG